MTIQPPPNPCHPDKPLFPFQAPLPAPQAHRLHADVVNNIEIGATRLEVYPGLTVPVWGYGIDGKLSSPGPLLEAAPGISVMVRWKNGLPGSVLPHGRRPELPFATAILPADGDPPVQNAMGIQGGTPEDVSMSPIGWTAVHLHGAHSSSDSDGWPDNMVRAGGFQLAAYENTYDNMDLGLAKVGQFLWYHDHAMNGTRYHVFAGLAGGYFVRDPAEAKLGLPVSADDGEILLLLQDRNLDCTDGQPRFVHKTTRDTAEFFGPLTLVNGLIWPRLALRPAVYRLRLLNGSNARAYRLHLVSVKSAGGKDSVTLEHGRILVIGTDGGLLWRAWQLGDGDALTMGPAERLDVLLDLTGLADGSQLFFINSAQAPFDGVGPPDIATLWSDGAPGDRNPYPWVMRIDVANSASTCGKEKSLYTAVASAELNPAFRRLVHDQTPAANGPRELKIEGHVHRTILLGEQPAGHLFLHEIVEDPQGQIQLQLPNDDTPHRYYRVEGWAADDGAPSKTRVSFYDRVALRPRICQWQVWRFINTTVDTHPIHIHQSMFQPLGDAAVHFLVTDSGGNTLYDPETRRTWAPLVPETDETHPDGKPGRTYDPHETRGWKDVIRVDPGDMVEVAIRFDTPGRYVYHCHVLEHEDTEMMRPIVVTVMPMEDGDDNMPGMVHQTASTVPAALS